MNVLILKFRNIGDVLLISPLLSNIKKNYPNSEIDVGVNKGSESVIELNNNVDNIIIYNREKIKSLPFHKRMWSEIKFYLNFKKKKYDVVINLTDGDRGAQISLITQSPIRIGYQSNSWFLRWAYTQTLPSRGYRHTVEVNLDPLRIMNIPIVEKQVRVYWGDGEESFIKNKDLVKEGFVHIHPVSRWLFKCINDKTMAKIIDYIELELSIRVVITSSPAKGEFDKVNSILSLCKSKPVNLAGKLTLLQVASLNNKSKFFIGVDTAIMHMSAANDVPVLAFFGPSGTDHWGPWDNSLMQSGYNKRNGIQKMGIHRVIAESRYCQPCGRDGCNGSKVSNCLMDLDIDIIKKNIQEMLIEQAN